ncbi:MAG: T9SS type A sorting domain-containing protein [Ignavibacteriaceae bacterium]
MSSKKINKILILMIGMLFLVPGLLRAEGNKKDGGKSLNKTNAQIAQTWLDINNISTYFYNNGISDISPAGNSGFVFPQGSGKTAVFTAGLLWGAKVAGDPDPRVGGTAYRTGIVPGAVLPDGTAGNPGLDKYRIYRVRPDVYPGGPDVNLDGEASNEGTSAAALRTQFEKDWTEWPTEMGAPYVDKNNNGTYDPGTDVPGVPNASMTIWFVANDLDPGQSTYLYGANPLGLQVSETVWAYNRTGALGNMYFRKFQFINVTNRSSLTPTTFNDMYVSMFADVDLGNAGDDFVGVDTVLSLQYCYNASATDATYAPLPPPAVGFDFFQGPLVNGVAGQDLNKNGVDDASDYGIFKGQKVGPGKINLPMTAAYYFANGDPNIGDPPQGDIDGSRQFYNFFQGKFGVSGQTFKDLATGAPTTYALNGDPQTGSGWLDGVQLPAGDRRQGSASGPFTMAPGDTQEVVVAEIIAGALPNVNNITAIGLLKYYDGLAQVLYDNNFDLPAEPAAPVVKAVELSNQINLDWGSDLAAVSATEGYNIMFNGQNYKFEGYNVYQLPSASATKAEGKLIATFDVANKFRVILGKDFDAKTGQIVLSPQQLGNNTGISHYLEITSDKLTNTPLVNGVKYYYAVTAYGVLQSYDKDTPIDNFPLITSVENVINTMTVVPHAENPQEVSLPTGSYDKVTHTVGAAGGGVYPYIINPSQLTGDNYKVFWSQRQEVRNQNGDWVAASTVSKNILPNGVDSINSASVDIAGLYGATAGTYELQFTLNYTSVDYDWVDGVKLTFPSGVTILNVPAFSAGNGDISPIVEGNVVKLGLTDNSYTGNGPFTGGETWSVLVQGSVPMPVDWVVYDDAYGGAPLNASGTTTVTTVGQKTRLAKYWNLLDMTTNEMKLTNQSIMSHTNQFPARDDLSANLLVSIPDYLQPQIDGFRIGVNGGYAAPLTQSQSDVPTLNGVKLTNTGSYFYDNNYILTDFTYFGYPDGTVNSSLPAYISGASGTTDLNQLQQDVQLRFTGVVGDTTIGGNTIAITKSGGSMITLIGASGYSIANHPLNPNPGSTAPFQIRVPFEVWNVDTDTQINALMWDRSGDPTADGGASWTQVSREYLWLVNTAYSETVLSPTSQDVKDHGTWNEVLYQSTFTTGDVLNIVYDNPVQIGVDEYQFSPSKSTYNNLAKAANEVDKINVFPNPYYGVNSQELNKYNRFVTFSHLPNNATIRIFNLAGVMVRTIVKSGSDQFQRWDLNNENGLPVASGLYIAYVDMPDVGKTKILKFTIIQEQQVLDRF